MRLSFVVCVRVCLFVCVFRGGWAWIEIFRFKTVKNKVLLFLVVVVLSYSAITLQKKTQNNPIIFEYVYIY